MSSSLCVMRCACEECEDMKACDIYQAEYRLQQLEERHIEDWHERLQAEKEAQ